MATEIHLNSPSSPGISDFGNGHGDLVPYECIVMRIFGKAVRSCKGPTVEKTCEDCQVNWLCKKSEYYDLT